MTDDWTVDDILHEATHSSVTRQRLTKTNRGRIGLFQKVGLLRGWLYDKPFVQYIDDGEVVEYLFVSPNPVTEIAAGQEHELDPINGYSAIIGITDKRILIVVAQEPTNETREISYSDIEKFALQPLSDLTIDTERDGNPVEPSARVRFEFETADRVIHFYSGPSQSLKLSEVTEKLGPNIQRRTNGAEWSKKEIWIDTQNEYRIAMKEYNQFQNKIAELAERAEDSSVTPSRLEDIWDQLNYGEQPHYYTTGSHHQHQITRSHGQNPANLFDHEWAVFSDRRIIIQNDSDNFEIQYRDILDFTVNQRVRELDSTTEELVQMDIELLNEYHVLDLQSLSQRQISDLVNFIQEKL